MKAPIILIGDCLASLRGLPDQSVHTCVTSPPYFGLRSYLPDDHPQKALEIGLDETPDAYVVRLVEVFREVRRVLRDDGTLWLNLGDSYGAVGGNTYAGFNERWSGTGGDGSKQDATLKGVTDRKIATGLRPKNLLGIPWRVAFALQDDGWYLRQDIIWHKPNPMPESVTDRCTKAHEYVFLLSKSARYFFDAEAVKEPAINSNPRKFTDGGKDKQRGHGRRHAGFNGRYTAKVREHGAPETRNRRSVWTVATKPYSGAHFATFPPDLIEPCILAGSPRGGTVCDPFGGSGTTAGVAIKHGRHAILCELNEGYEQLIHARVRAIAGDTCDMFMGAAE
jgi:DNA modification methylase